MAGRMDRTLFSHNLDCDTIGRIPAHQYGVALPGLDISPSSATRETRIAVDDERTPSGHQNAQRDFLLMAPKQEAKHIRCHDNLQSTARETTPERDVVEEIKNVVAKPTSTTTTSAQNHVDHSAYHRQSGSIGLEYNKSIDRILHGDDSSDRASRVQGKPARIDQPKSKVSDGSPDGSADSPYTDASNGVVLCDDDSFVSTPQSFHNIENLGMGKTSRRRVQPSRKRRRPNKFSDAPPNVVRRSRRQTRNLHPIKGVSSSVAFSKVKDYHTNYHQLQCIVELPAHACPGERYYVKWPTVFPCHPPNMFVIEVPFSIKLIPTNARRLVKVVAPGLSFDPLKEAIISLLQVPYPERRKSNSSRVRVGANYQATILPRDEQVLTDGLTIKQSPLMDKFWDASRAKAAASERGEDVIGFVDEAMELNEKILRMEALHDNHYHVASARAQLPRLLSRAIDIPIALTAKEQQVVSDSVDFSRKQFRQVSKEIGRTSCACMVHYYNWKKSKCYQIVKQELAAEKDYCAVCDDGGELIVCDNCRNAYHFACHVPPLHVVPTGDWFCAQCLKSPAKMRRLPFGPRLDTSPMKTPNNNTFPQSKPIQSMPIRKPETFLK